MGIKEFLQDPLGLGEPSPIDKRQEVQWHAANQALADALDAINNENHQAAIASALVGLLSLQLSKM